MPPAQIAAAGGAVALLVASGWMMATVPARPQRVVPSAAIAIEATPPIAAVSNDGSAAEQPAALLGPSSKTVLQLERAARQPGRLAQRTSHTARARGTTEPSSPRLAVQQTAPSGGTSKVTVPKTSDVDALAREVALIGRVRKLVESHSPQAALDGLGVYQARFPNGVLREEALLLRALSLCELGRAEEARRVAQQLKLSAPTTPHLRRLDAVCFTRP
jgi:hypothetical protein